MLQIPASVYNYHFYTHMHLACMNVTHVSDTYYTAQYFLTATVYTVTKKILSSVTKIYIYTVQVAIYPINLK